MPDTTIDKPKILIPLALNPARFEPFQNNFQIDVLPSNENRRQQLLDVIHNYDGLLNMSIDVDTEILYKARKLKIIANYGVGYDNIDIGTAQKRGIAVSNTPVSTTNPTANHTIGLILALMRRISEHDRSLKQGKLQNWYSGKELGHSPEGKTLGIIGMGRIGKAVAKRAIAMDINICYINRNRLTYDEEKNYSAVYKNMSDLLQSSDIVTIHTPLTDSTKNLITSKELNLLKSSSYLINTARGGIINESDLINHLKQNKIAGAALDVFENEPNPNSEFFSLQNVVLTPHSGTGTYEARNNMMNEALGNIMAFLKGEEMTSRIV